MLKKMLNQGDAETPPDGGASNFSMTIGKDLSSRPACRQAGEYRDLSNTEKGCEKKMLKEEMLKSALRRGRQFQHDKIEQKP